MSWRQLRLSAKQDFVLVSTAMLWSFLVHMLKSTWVHGNPASVLQVLSSHAQPSKRCYFFRWTCSRAALCNHGKRLHVDVCTACGVWSMPHFLTSCSAMTAYEISKHNRQRCHVKKTENSKQTRASTQQLTRMNAVLGQVDRHAGHEDADTYTCTRQHVCMTAC